ncbi:MAG: AMP-binding protein [Clostridium sp.]|nr:AMP-binding protein [Prevotella sp.]MCM1428598.1 AMP-binding protein [Clostridium sp.]MCM1475047.1 AMP-binding protein [Muribaculaceae bacterium]
MDKKEYGSLNELIYKGIVNNWDRMALTDMGGVNYQFRDVALTIEKLRILFEAAGVREGDKVAICGKNSSNWAVTFIACLVSNVVAVPILHEFKPDMIHHLLNHSGSKLLFVDAAIWENLDEQKLPDLVGAIYISEFGMPLSRLEHLTDTRNRINEIFGQKFPYSYDKKDFKAAEDSPEELALISYTSGSTGMSKGVMLPRRSIWSNVRFCIDNLNWLLPGDGMVNMLPLAHLYGMVIEMLHPFCKGCHCHFLTRLPSPKIILKAFADVKPKLIITVPLILEKIVKGSVFPKLQKPVIKMLLKVPFLDDQLFAKVNEGLINALGGNVKQLIIGGAALNRDVEKLLTRIKFPITVGYGMTECGPLITYVPWEETKPGSVGKIVTRMEMKVDSPDPQNEAGNLWVKGANVMTGYYKNEKATMEVMSGPDGWMNTGDLCTIDEDGYLYISGRSKNMILGPSGQNIYPEEIEAILNGLPYVGESLIIDKGGKLVALVYPDVEAEAVQGLSEEDLAKQMDQNLATLNAEMPTYSKISAIEIMAEEFEKTPKRSIKRFLYQH